MKRLLTFCWNHYANWVLASVLHVCVFVILWRKKIISPDQPLFTLFLLGLSLFLFFVAFNWVLSWVPSRWARFSLNVSCLLLLSVLVLYQALRGTPLDFALVYTNLNEVFSGDGMSHVLITGGPMILLAGLTVFVWMLYQEFRYQRFSRVYRRQQYWIVMGMVFCLMNAALFLVDARNPNQLYAFSRSAMLYFKDPEESLLLHLDVPEEYPQLRHQVSSKTFPKQPKYIFLVLVESLSSRYMNEKNEAGVEITPFMNGLSDRSLFFEEFYANSMQTARGQVAAVCSVIPSYRQKIMNTYVNNRFRCLPEILAEVGYTTTFIQGQESLDYDNTGNFMRSIGFQNVLSMDKSFVGPEDAKFVWGWGLQDDKFYTKTLDWLGAEVDRDPDSKHFTLLATISNHQAFDQMPADQKFIYPKPKSFRENYINSLHLTDRYLEHFFRELEARGYAKDSLVIVSGDHGFPTGERKNTSNEKGFHNELFRVPLFVTWGSNIPTARIEKHAFSQLDIAPSILDWIGVDSSNSFVGFPLPLNQVEANQKARIVPISQPYDGVYLGSIMHPWKYVKSLSTGDEYLFNLDEDPNETKNLSKDPAKMSELVQLNAGLRQIYLNQRLLDENRIYPMDASDLQMHSSVEAD